MNPGKCISAAILIAVFSCTKETELSQWRGPDRNGTYNETGLLKQWPDGGPELLWSVNGLGIGYGSACVTGKNVFILGMKDSTGYAYCFDAAGKAVWQKEYGKDWTQNYNGPRSTPTYINGLLYFVSGRGVATCMDARNGNIKWQVDMPEAFGAQDTYWGFAESPLIDGERIILTPGGKEHNVVALDRFSGKLIWTSKGNGEPSAFCSPVLVTHNNTRLVVAQTAGSVLGIDAENGQVCWTIPLKQEHSINANNPIYHDGRIYCACEKGDTNTGHLMIKLSEDGKTAEAGWRNQELFNLMEGLIWQDGYIFSSNMEGKNWYCLDAVTGTLKYSSDQVDGGAIIYADGLFYCYGTSGTMALVQAGSDSCRVVGSFEVKLGTDQHWAHPVIHDAKLYIRHGDVLMCYDIADKSL